MSQHEPTFLSIDIEELSRLHDRELFLNALESAGVADWAGYETAQDIYESDVESGMTDALEAEENEED